jgi:hypothetical protein
MVTKVKESEAAGAGEASGDAATDPRTAVERKLDEAMNRDTGADDGDGGDPDERDEGKPEGGDDRDADDPDADEGDGGDPDENAEDQLQAGEIKGLTEQAQAAVNKRIAKIVKARKTVEKKAAKLETELTELRGKLDGTFEATVKKLGLHGDYVSKDDAALLEKYEKLRSMKRWLRENREGYVGDGTDEKPEVDARAIARREAEVEDELLELAPRAKSLWDSTLKQIREDLLAGRKARLGKATDGKDKGQGQERKPPAKPPKIPASGEGARKPPASASRREKPAFDQEEVKKGGGKSALENQFRKVFGGGDKP